MRCFNLKPEEHINESFPLTIAKKRNVINICALLTCLCRNILDSGLPGDVVKLTSNRNLRRFCDKSSNSTPIMIQFVILIMTECHNILWSLR